jgi:Ca2+-binding RTX toxin-like protein
MSRSSKFLKKRAARRAATRKKQPARLVPSVESLEPRLMLSVSAFFVPQVGLLTVTGDNLDNSIEVSSDAAGALLVNGGAVTIQGGTPTVANTALIQGFGLGGDDTIALNEANGALPGVELFGGDGNDELTGGSGIDQFFGQEGNDFADGQRGNDTAFLGAGDDTFQWDPGDGSDKVEGQAGSDTLLFNGSGGDENFDVAANGERVRFFRDLGNIVMDLDDIEAIDLNALGGADTTTVNDVSGTDLVEVNINLAGPDGTTGDGAADTVIVNGTDGDDKVEITGSGTSAAVTGLQAVVNITNAEGANDQLTVNTLGGKDIVDASGLAADIVQLTVDGGAGDDNILGSRGMDTLLGGDGDDFIDGQQGNDTAFLGAGDDTFQWDPGDGSDTVEGQAGSDTLLFNGSGGDEIFDVAANGERVRFFRNLGNIEMDLDDIEAIDLNALGGVDTTTVNDVSGTDLVEVNIDLADTIGGTAGDGQADEVIVNGTNDDDAVQVFGDATGVTVFGLAAQVNIANAEATNDRLKVNALAGNDVVAASGLAAGAIQLTADGGDGDDILLGSAGDDELLGGDGDDVLLGGPGLDNLDGGPGNNILVQD